MNIAMEKKRISPKSISLAALIFVSMLLVSGIYSHFSFAERYKNQKFLEAVSSNPNSTFTTSPIKEFAVPQNSSYPLGLVTDARGNLWFGEVSTNNIEEFFPSNQSFRAFHIPVASQLSWVWTPVFDSTGRLWFATTNGSVIWRLDPTKGQFVSFSTGNPNAQPYALTYDSTSNQIWFTSFLSNQFGVFQLSNGDSASLLKLYNLSLSQASEVSSPNVGAGDIALDSRGNVYVSEALAGQIAKFNQSNGQLEKVWKLPKFGNPLGLVVDPRTDDVWFTNHATDLFGYINQTSNMITQYSTSIFLYEGGPVITLPYWIFESSSGMIWFNEHIGNRIARFDPNSSALTEFSVPTQNAEPIKLTLDDERGLVWFTEFTGNKIGMLEQNQSLDSQLFVSTTSLTLTGATVAVQARVSSGNLLPLNVSGTTSPIGVLQPNFTITSQSISSTQVNLQIARGSFLSPGFYNLTFCSNQALPVNSCAIVSIYVAPMQISYYNIIVAVAAVSIALGTSIYFVRKWRS